MTYLFTLLVGMAVDPVQLDRAPLTVKRMVSVPGVLDAWEGNQGAFIGRHFDGVILKIGGAAQEAQLAAGFFPGRVHVQQDGDQLAGRISMDLSVGRPRAPAHGDHGGLAGKLNSQLRAQCRGEFGAFQGVDQRGKAGAVF